MAARVGRERAVNTTAEERHAVRADGLDPDDPAVVAALDLVRWALSLYAR